MEKNLNTSKFKTQFSSSSEGFLHCIPRDCSHKVAQKNHHLSISLQLNFFTTLEVICSFPRVHYVCEKSEVLDTDFWQTIGVRCYVIVKKTMKTEEWVSLNHFFKVYDKIKELVELNKSSISHKRDNHSIHMAFTLSVLLLLCELLQ